MRDKGTLNVHASAAALGKADFGHEDVVLDNVAACCTAAA
jgi:hypothetical protein